MEALRDILSSPLGRGLLIGVSLVLLLSVFVPEAAFSDNTNGDDSAAGGGQADRQRMVQQVAAKWIQVGREQYGRGFYKAAEQSFLRAKDYQDYLDAAQRQELDGLFEKAHVAATESERVSANIAAAQQMLAEGRTAEARTLFEAVKDSPYLSDEQRQLIEGALARATGSLTAEQSRIAALYNQSVEYYNAGDLEKAREGFLEVAKSNLMVAPEGSRAQDYLAKIDARLSQEVKAEQPPETGVGEIEEVEAEPSKAAGEIPTEAGVTPMPEQPERIAPAVEQAPARPLEAPAQPEKGGYIEVIKRRQNILRSHTSAVVNDALAKARSYMGENKFDQARKAIDYAQSIVNNNRVYLGEELFTQYSDELQQMRGQIDTAQADRDAYLADLQRRESAAEAKKARDQMEADRQKRVAELMKNAENYQRQQRYEEALGQLQSLLAIEPGNNRALILKDTLEDTISFRKQLEVVKEKQRERADLMLEADKVAIPWAKEITYPKNWREISERRQPEEAIGQDPASVRVYEQLEQLVDLSDFNPDMPFSQAIDLLRQSVDPPLQINPLWGDLYDNADIDRETPINMDPLPQVKLGAALKLLLEAVGGGFADLGYSVQNGIITIATEESIPSELVPMVYDVTDLVGPAATFRSDLGTTTEAGGGGGEQGIQFEVQPEEEEVVPVAERIAALITLIQETVAPDTWFDAGGEGTITDYQDRFLAISQTREVHNEISNLLKELRKSQGYQVAIEARFLKVRENFLEEIGLDVDFTLYPLGKGKWDPLRVTQASADAAVQSATGVPGTFGSVLAGAPVTAAFEAIGGYGTVLDDLQVSFLLRATQAHEDATVITAPRAAVLSGEAATLRLERAFLWATNVEVQQEEGVATATGAQPRLFYTVDYETSAISAGTVLNITPTITPDKKHVLLNIEASLVDFLGFRDQVLDLSAFGADATWTLQFPEQELSLVRTRVSVPDRGTLLLGGQKLGAETETEVGVPVLSKIPILGRAFRNTSKIKDRQILLILVKPTIILHEETEAEAVAAMEQSY